MVFTMKKMYRILMVLMFGILTQATSCEKEFPEQTYIMSEDKVPQETYLTTISADYFKTNIAGHGWKWKESWRIGEDGIGMHYGVTNESDFIPNDLYFGTDSMTVFLYRQDRNLRRTKGFTYDAANNRILSDAIAYMQLTYADSVNISFIEQNGGYYYKSCYERMLPYELNARFNGSLPENP